jgi:polygalacturonase
MADWSYAGYMGMQANLPDSRTFPAKFNVKDYGAKGDGKTGAVSADACVI